MEGSASSARATSAPVVGTSSAVSNVDSRLPIISVSLAKRLPYAPLTSTRTWPSRGTSVLTAASTENVPLPCIGTQTCVSAPLITAVRRARRRAVTSLNALSHDPQSRSIADRVASDVVSGPGVSRTGSRSWLLIRQLRWYVRVRLSSHRHRGLAPRLRARQQQTRNQRIEQAHRRRRGDDQRRHRGR